jgi:hypothetical protein
LTWINAEAGKRVINKAGKAASARREQLSSDDVKRIVRRSLPASLQLLRTGWYHR